MHIIYLSINNDNINLPTKVKLIAYKTLCRPRMEFAVEVWDPTANKYIQMLEMVQNKAVRFVSKGERGSDR